MNSSIMNKSFLAVVMLMVACFAGFAVVGEDTDAEGVTYPEISLDGVIDDDDFGVADGYSNAKFGNVIEFKDGKITGTLVKAAADVASAIDGNGAMHFLVIAFDMETGQKVAFKTDTTEGSAIGFIEPEIGTTQAVLVLCISETLYNDNTDLKLQYEIVPAGVTSLSAFSGASKIVQLDVNLVDELVYNVSFVVEGTTISTYKSNEMLAAAEPITGVNGKEFYPIPSDPSKPNFVFAGWAVDGKIISEVVLGEIVIPTTYKFTADTQIVAQFEPVQLTVKLMVGDNVYSEQTVLYGNKAVRPVDPAIDGMNFIEWQVEGVAYDFNSAITNDLVIKAYFEEVPEVTVFDVIFKMEGKADSIQKSDSIVIPDTTRDGYTFKGWVVYGSADFVDPVKFNYTTNTTFLAVYEAALPPTPEEPGFLETTTGQCTLILALFVLGLALYQANRMGYFAVVKNKLFRKKVEAPVEGEEAGKP